MMKSRVLSPLLALLLTLSTAPHALAQTVSSGQSVTNINAQDWQRLHDLKPDKKILVEFKSGGQVKGKIVSLIDGTLTLSDDGDIYVLKQQDIQRVYRLKGGWSRGKLARIGAVIGFIVGGEIGFRREMKLERDPNRIPSDADEIPMIAGMSLGTLIGAGLGALLGGRRKGKLLYEAK